MVATLVFLIDNKQFIVLLVDSKTALSIPLPYPVYVQGMPVPYGASSNAPYPSYTPAPLPLSENPFATMPYPSECWFSFHDFIPVSIYWNFSLDLHEKLSWKYFNQTREEMLMLCFRNELQKTILHILESMSKFYQMLMFSFQYKKEI